MLHTHDLVELIKLMFEEQKSCKLHSHKEIFMSKNLHFVRTLLPSWEKIQYCLSKALQITGCCTILETLEVGLQVRNTD
jgi:hypothetical protein